MDITEDTETHQDSSIDEIGEVTAAELLGVVVEGAEVYATLSENFMDSFEFYGMKLKDWATEMMISIPQRLDQEQFRALMVELGTKYQRASNYYSVASSLAKAFGSGSEIRKSDVVSAIVANYAAGNKKRPAGAVIDRMADSYLKSSLSTRVAASIVRDFWKQRLETLEQVRKILEQIGMSLHVEIKFTSS